MKNKSQYNNVKNKNIKLTDVSSFNRFTNIINSYYDLNLKVVCFRHLFN